jgi:glycosyltransferase involved in cell wall biosynthesis
MAVRRVWSRADLILCASSVTKRSLIAAGASPDLCRVVPYGVTAAPEPPPYTGGDRYRVLFVGTGIQRKGLHHLLAAWREALLPPGAELTLVCRSIDPGLAAEAAKTPGCVLLGGLPRSRLRELFRRSDLFALPSLLEGFGQSYLEALAEGCPVLGTADTGVPDLGGEDDGVFCVPAGDAIALAGALGRVAGGRGDTGLRARAWLTSRDHSWERFRGQLAEELA